MYEIAASDAPKWVAAVKEMTARVQALGPNPLRLAGRLRPESPVPAEELGER